MSLSQLVELIAERSRGGIPALQAHFQGVRGLATRLLSDVDHGLTTADLTDLQTRAHFFGSNRMPSAPLKNLFQLMWDAMSDTTLIILSIAAVISFIFGLTLGAEKDTDWIEGVAIMVAVIAVVVVTAVNDYQKDRQFQALQAKQVGEWE